MLPQRHACTITALLSISGVLTAQQFEPNVTVIERLPARRSSNIVALPRGSPWCDGRPTVWFPGHKNFLEDRPSCKSSNNEWSQFRPGTAVLDVIADELNALDDPTVIDRHGCGALDVNNDGILDLYCMVGANSGKQEGYNELYVSQKDGSLKKVLRHALQRFNTARTRATTLLKDVNGTELVFISASHGPRDDGRPNQHAMFRKNGSGPNVPWKRRYFDYVPGPWHVHSRVTCAQTIDANRDGLDDLLIGNEGSHAFLYLQNPDGSFTDSIFTGLPGQRYWRNARVADLSGDGIPDLAVVIAGLDKSILRVFWGSKDPPYFDFNGPLYFQKQLPYSAPDLEIFDANGDGVRDLYVAQADERRKEKDGSPRVGVEYCAGRLDAAMWWTVNPKRKQMPPDDWVPPADKARDFLFLGVPGQADPKKRFDKKRMKHAVPGCGYYVQKFEENSLLLAHGGFDRPGYQVILEW